MYLDDVFGTNSRLEYAAWVKESTTKAVYMFNTKALRSKLLERANLEAKY